MAAISNAMSFFTCFTPLNGFFGFPLCFVHKETGLIVQAFYRKVNLKRLKIPKFSINSGRIRQRNVRFSRTSKILCLPARKTLNFIVENRKKCVIMSR